MNINELIIDILNLPSFLNTVDTHPVINLFFFYYLTMDAVKHKVFILNPNPM